MNSEIIGNPADVPWAFVFEQVDDIARHPAQLYESMSYLAIFIFMMWQYWKTTAKDKLGFLFETFLALLWTARFFVEFYKKSQGGFEESFNVGLSTGQLLSIPFIVAGIFFMATAKNRSSIA